MAQSSLVHRAILARTYCHIEPYYHIYKIRWRFCIAANPPFPKIDHKHLIASVTLAYEAEVPQTRASHEI